METFLRPPLIVYRHMRRVYLFKVQRHFGTRPDGFRSFGLGSRRAGVEGGGGGGLGHESGPRQASLDSKVEEFYQDAKMQKLLDKTFDRISIFQKSQMNKIYPTAGGFSNTSAGRQRHSLNSSDMTSDSSSGKRLGSLLSPSGLGGGSGMGGEGADGGYPSLASSKDGFDPKGDMFALDNKQIMKIAFAEGYFYGQHNQRKPKFSFLKRLLQESALLLFLGGIFYVFVGVNGPFKRVVYGKRYGEVQPEEMDVRFVDVKGCDEAKQELQDIVEFLKRPAKFSNLGGKLPKGVLLVGPPGTGKTLLARAVAGEAGVPFFHASGSEFDEILVGQGARRVRDLFEKAKLRAPCVVFIDEIDSVGGKRTNSALHPYANQTINQLLSEMDGFAQNQGVIVLGATNRAKDLDKALLRPGRFDIQVQVPVPDYKGRYELLEHYLGKVRLAPTHNINLDTICRNTVGFTGADIENMINQAALKAATDDKVGITVDLIEWARDKILMGPERRSRLPDKDQNLMTAVHEGGHALVAYYTKQANALHKVTIVPRGDSLGHTAVLPERDHYSQTREQLAAAIDVKLGGRVAEELIFGSDRVTTGCSNDLDGANSLAASMVKHFGMSDKVGVRVIDRAEDGGNHQFSDATSALVDTEITRLLEESRLRVHDLLTSHMDELKKLAEALVKYETLDAAEVKLIIEGKDPRPGARQGRERERELRIKQPLNAPLVGPPHAGPPPPEGLPFDLLK